MKIIKNIIIIVFVGFLIGLLISSLYGSYLGPFFLLHVFAFIFFTYINIYIHEFGHAIAGKVVGIKVKKIMIGNGREVFKRNILGVPFVITNNLEGGFTYPYDIDKQLIRLRFFVFSAGGFLAQGLITLLFIMYFGFELKAFFIAKSPNLSNAFIMSNLFGIILALIPMKVSIQGLKIPNDGHRLIKTPFMKEKEIHKLLALLIVNDAHSHFENKEFEQAEAIYKKCLEQYPDEPIPMINLSVTLLKQLKFEESLCVLQHLKAQNREKKYDFMIFNNLAWVFLLKHDKDSLSQADEYSMKAFQLNPKVPFICGTRGCVLIDRDKIDEGMKLLMRLTHLKRPIDEKTNPPPGFFYVAFGYFKKGQKDHAFKYLKHLSKFFNKMDLDSKYLFEIVRNKTNNFDHYFGVDLEI